jgi:hypothetical protein
MEEGRDKKGLFIKGNKLSVGNEGRGLTFPDPKELESLCDKYFIWADSNPWIKQDVVRGGESAGTPLLIPIQRPYTLIGLCQYIGITKSTFNEYAKLSEFSDLTMRVRDKIDNQQIEGSLVGLFNSNLTARIQGLADKKEHDVIEKEKPFIFKIINGRRD